MALYEPSIGILETYVTWNDVEKMMQKKFETKAKFGEDKNATNISEMKVPFSIITNQQKPNFRGTCQLLH